MDNQMINMDIKTTNNMYSMKEPLVVQNSSQMNMDYKNLAIIKPDVNQSHMINVDLKNQQIKSDIMQTHQHHRQQQQQQTGQQTGVAKKKRKRCGLCAGCFLKNNCMQCGPCKSTRSHQICKMRKCEQLKTKKEKQREVRVLKIIFLFFYRDEKDYHL